MSKEPYERDLPLQRVDVALDKLAWLREERIWPTGKRYLWTDAFGLVLLVSLHRHTEENRYLEEARWLVSEVDRVLGRERGIRIGEDPDRDGQYYHYLAMWLFALERLGSFLPEYRERAVELVHEVHDPFLVPGTGVHWKMLEDLSGPYPGFGFGAMDAFHGYVVYRLLDDDALAEEIAQLEAIVEQTWRGLHIAQDLGLGMMLWLTHFHPEEDWAGELRRRCLAVLDTMWVDPPGYFCRHPDLREVKFAFTNYGVSLGLQSVGESPERIARLNEFFESYRSGDEYDREAITHVMACTSWFPGDFLRT